ncbi:MAG: nuclear transport factor 2 family protein [Bacteroidales bacterium]|nr:nuclear transport factor 2 family protein [Bacteroidales bacterium]MCF8337850.1 nuclear transport factor 2 family protein [Bacteroidales bacterium]
MRRITFLLMIIAIFMAQSCRESCDKEKAVSDVQVVLEKYVIANENHNIDLLKDVWAQDDDIVIFGTESDEKLIGWKQVKNTFLRQFDAFDETYISVTDQNIKINCNGKTAWFSEILNYNYTTTEGKSKSFEGIRFTGVLEKRDGKWLIVQSHMSIPYDSMEKKRYS